jgi:menaquinone-dependent protoporphyrinogen oxidase
MHGEQGSMARILILYSTTDGHTVEICRRITQTIEMNGDNVELQDIKDGPELVPGTFDKVVIGASIRYGKHQSLVHEFIKKNQSILESHPNAFFSVNVEEDRLETAATCGICGQDRLSEPGFCG